MSLKNAALLAMIGTVVLTILLLLKLVNKFLAFMHGLIPAMVLLLSLIYAFAALSVAVFFYVFHPSTVMSAPCSTSDRFA